MLGIFDSGLGGLTVLQQLRRRLPRHDITYLADQAHVPYGDRTEDELVGFLRDNMRYLESAASDAIVVACNTTCAIAIKHGWPTASVPVLNLIDNAAEAIAALGARKVGVLATTVTTKTRAYGNAIRARLPGIVVEEVAAPALVPLVEAGRYSGRAVRAAVEEACESFSRDLDVLVYGCTHYPILDPHFAAIFGEGMVRLDPAIAQADATVKLVDELGISEGSGATLYATSGEPMAFAAAVRALLAEENPQVVFAHDILTRIGNM
ncbi:MAG TPA: glutamate racemase [Candidatus Acidoferrales bacterium]|nr:glutamate racemase [Candidatus Acidoferrales bacterium]